MRPRILILSLIVIIFSGCAGTRSAKWRYPKVNKRGHGCGCSIQEINPEYASENLFRATIASKYDASLAFEALP